MLGVGLWGGAKGNSHIGKGHRVGASVYFGHMSSFFFFICKCGCDEYIIVQNVQSSAFGIGMYSITPLVKKMVEETIFMKCHFYFLGKIKISVC